MRIAIHLLVVLTAHLGAVGGRGTQHVEGAGRPTTVVPAVEVVQAREGAVPLRERLTGTVRASGEVAIFPDVSGPAVEALAQNSDAVRKAIRSCAFR